MPGETSDCILTCGIEDENWWYAAFPDTPTPSKQRGHPRGATQMLTVIAYDITDPKRLRKVADCCLDFGVRVQYSVFEARLEADQFNHFWARLTSLADPTLDRLVAYPLHGAQMDKIRTFGNMVCSETAVTYVF